MMAVALKENTTPLVPNEHGFVRPHQVRRAAKPVINKKIKRMAGIFVVLLVINLIVQALVAQAQYRMSSSQAALSEQERRINLIYLNLADLGSDERIERIAEEKLGMHHALSSEVAFVPAGEHQNPVIGAQSEENSSPLFLASRSDVHQTGIAQRFNDWLQGLGRTLAGSGPSDLQ